MIENQEDVYFYITVMNENYTHPDMPKGVQQGIVDGIYLFSKSSVKGPTIQLMGSGVILREVIEAASILESDFKIAANVFSVTSFNELRKNALDIERWNRLNPDKGQKISHIESAIIDTDSPIIASTDYMKSFPEQIARFLPNKFIALGTDGYGRSDSRAALRSFFEVDRYYIVIAALTELVNTKKIDSSILLKAIKKYQLDGDKPNPMNV